MIIPQKAAHKPAIPQRRRPTAVAERPFPVVPQLLVSVRDANEALAAVRGGADIVDVKEPTHGPLGLADVDVLRAIRAALPADHPATQFSMALGELREWDTPSENQQAVQSWVSTFAFRGYLKAGPAGTAADNANQNSLASKWRDLISRFRTDTDSAATSSATPEWVVVAYADWQRAQSPPPLTVLKVAIEAGCSTLLLDTFTKDETQLTDWLDATALRSIRTACTESRVRLALAGRVNAQSLSKLVPAGPDIIGVRGAVCRDGNRGNSLCSDSVRRFRDQIESVFTATSTSMR